MMGSETHSASRTVLLLLIGSLCVHLSAGAPNLVVLLADDVGYGDLGFTGHPTILTPNLNRLASEGMRFTQTYAGAPVCSPSRASLLTGRLPIRNGVYTSAGYPLDMVLEVFYPWSTGSLPDTEITLPSILKQANYTSAIIGKWHLGHVDALPTERGFDYFFGLPYSQDEGCPPGVGFDCSDGWEKLFPPTPLYRNLTIIEQPVDLTNLTPRYNSEAIEFMENSVKANTPFFLYLAYDEAHVPLFASPQFQNTSLRGLYGDAVQEMDASVGEIVNKIRELEIEDNTLVFFVSDNGPYMKQGLNGGTPGQLRGEKSQTWEGGMRSPCIAWWPNTIQPGTVNQDIASLMDIFPTICELANIPLPSGVTYDGVSLVPALKENGPIPRECYFYYRSEDLQAVRCGAYKAHYITRCGYCAEPPVHHNPPILYNVEQDLEEYWPLNVTEYASVLQAIESAKQEHLNNLVKGTPELNALDPLVAPCCNKDTNCYCQP